MAINFGFVRQVPREQASEEYDEMWVRWALNDYGSISAARWADDAPARGWQLDVNALAVVRDDPLESTLRQRIAEALAAVPGVDAILRRRWRTPAQV